MFAKGVFIGHPLQTPPGNPLSATLVVWRSKVGGLLDVLSIHVCLDAWQAKSSHPSVDLQKELYLPGGPPPMPTLNF